VVTAIINSATALECNKNSETTQQAKGRLADIWLREGKNTYILASYIQVLLSLPAGLGEKTKKPAGYHSRQVEV